MKKTDCLQLAGLDIKFNCGIIIVDENRQIIIYPLVWGANKKERIDKMFTPTTQHTIKYTYQLSA